MKSRYWYLLVLIFPLSAVLGYVKGGLLSYSTVFLFVVVLPIAERMCGEDFDYPRAAKSESHTYYRAVLYSMALSQVILLFWGAYAVSHSHSLFEAIGFTFAVGINGGIAFCAAHELIHKKNRLDNLMGNIILIATATGHAPMEHVLIHHGPFIAATPTDHVHAQSGDSIYKFYLKSMVEQRTCAYASEKKRLRRTGHSPISLRNRLLSLNLCSLLCALLLAFLFGYQAILYFIGAALLSSVVILDAAYIQHYGLERFALPNGSYERFNELHCWNSNYVLSNYLLFQLPRHSLHHMKPGLDYEVSTDNPGNPQLPYGYFMCGWFIYTPKVWHKLMSKLISDNFALRTKK